MLTRAAIATVLCVVVGLSPVFAAVTKDCSRVRGGLRLPEYVREVEDLHRGLAAASEVKPRLFDGTVDDQRGKVVVFQCGNGIAKGILAATAAATKEWKRKHVVFLNASTNLAGIDQWRQWWTGTYQPRPWFDVAAALANRQLSPYQVQVAHCGLTQTNPWRATTAAELVEVVQVLKNSFPNLRLVYLSDMPYTGYTTRPNGGQAPWPNVVHEAHLMADLARTQAGVPAGVWVDYLPVSADGVDENPFTADSVGRGLSYPCSALLDDGERLTPPARAVVGANVADRLRLDEVTAGWLR